MHYYRIHFRKSNITNKWEILSIANIKGNKSVIFIGKSRNYRKGDVIFDNSRYEIDWYLKVNNDNPYLGVSSKIDRDWLRLNDSLENKLKKLIDKYNESAHIPIENY